MKESSGSKSPYQPIPYRDGNNVVNLYEENFVDSVGNRALITKCDFIDKKGKINKGYDLRVKWIEEEKKYTGERKEKIIKSFSNVEEEKHKVYYDGYLSYFFYFEGSSHLVYNWESDPLCVSYMIFRMSNDFIVPNVDEDFLPYSNDYKEVLESLVDSEMIEEFLAIKFYRYKGCEFIEGNKAIMMFNKEIAKHCGRKIDYI